MAYTIERLDQSRREAKFEIERLFNAIDIDTPLDSGWALVVLTKALEAIDDPPIRATANFRKAVTHGRDKGTLSKT